MKVALSSKAAKQFERLNEPLKSRILSALKDLECEPPKGDIKPLSGLNEFRLRVGNYRVLFGIEGDIIAVASIAPRGQVYKGR